MKVLLVCDDMWHPADVIERGLRSMDWEDMEFDVVKTARDILSPSFVSRYDVLVNCAGIQRRNELEDFTIEDWDQVIEVNLTASWELGQMEARKMIEQGRGGKIINIASMLSFFGGFRIPAYSASKGGIAQITKAMAIGWAKYNIQVNAIAPGYMDTEMNTALKQDTKRYESILARIPAKRWGTEADMAGPCIFLASDMSNYVTGAILPVDGGYLVT